MSRASDRVRSMNTGKVGIGNHEFIIPDTLTCKNNLQYGPDKTWNVFDIYYEESNEKKHPTIISIHGGAYVSNTKESYEPYCMNLATRGFNVVNFTFRLAPEHIHPAMLEDVNTLITHLLKHQEEYGLDMENVFIVADSAGAHILSMYICMCINEIYAKGYDFQVPKGFLPKGIALNCGKYDVYKEIEANAMGMMATILMDYIGHDASAEKIQQNNSIDYINENFPPVYVMSSNEDMYQDQYKLLVQKLEELHVPNVHKMYGNEATKLGHVFHLDIFTDAAKECNDDECHFFKELIK